MKRNAVLLLAILRFSVPAVWARTIRVKFPPGRSESGGMDPLTYRLRARKGQMMLHLTSAKKNAVDIDRVVAIEIPLALFLTYRRRTINCVVSRYRQLRKRTT
jgi:hypothetical protein